MPKRVKKTVETVSIRLTEWVGTPTSIIVHTIIFVGIFSLTFVGVSLDSILLILTTAVSLEAIYLAIFIQMSVNRTTKSLAEVEEQVEDIAEDVEDIAEDVEDIEEDVGEISKSVDDLEDEVDELSTDAKEDTSASTQTLKAVMSVEKHLVELQKELENLKMQVKSKHS